MTTVLNMPAAGISTRDAFSWPSLNRKDLVSQTGLSKADGFETKTFNCRPKTRQVSANLCTNDIEGKLQLKAAKYLQALTQGFGRNKKLTGLNSLM